MFEGFLGRIGGLKEDKQDQSISLSYAPVPLTLALRKRKFEEEQRKLYGIEKTKKCDFF